MSWTTIPSGFLETLEHKRFAVINTVLLFFLIFFVSVASAEENRLRAVGPSDEVVVKELLNKVSRCCSERDFRGFLGCFTQNKASSIRKKVENAFICGTIDVDILDFFVISAEEDSMSFGVRYFLTEGESEKELLCSKMVAKKIGDSWLIDSEDIRSRSRTTPVKSFVAIDPPVNPRRQNVAQQGGWRKPNPANGGEEAWLPADILFMPGPSCANGKCGIQGPR